MDACDVAIIGGGPAGLSAALWTARYLHTVVVVDSGDPRNWETHAVNGYLGLPDVGPVELRGLGRREASRHGATLLDSTVVSIAPMANGTFTVCLTGGDKRVAKRVLLAYGLRDVWPRIPGLRQVYGSDAHVCPDCDGNQTVGKSVVVVGTGRRAAGMALNLTTWTRAITICTNGREFDDANLYEPQLTALGIHIVTQPIDRVCYEGDSMRGVQLAGGATLAADKLFFSLAQYPADDLAGQLACARDNGGHVVVDAHQQTSVPGVFAAGDLVPGPQLAIVAASEGAIAALAIHKSLVPAERTLAPLAAATPDASSEPLGRPA